MKINKNKIIEYAKQNYSKPILCMLTIIITLLSGKACNRIMPDDRVVRKEVLDTVKIIHFYNFNITDDSLINLKLKTKLKNIELVEKYDNRIKSVITKNNECTPNLILTSSSLSKAKGYTAGDAMPYFSLNISPLDGQYIDFTFNFIHNQTLKEIYSLSLNIYKLQDNKRIYVMSEQYNIKHDNNLIRITNTLTKGKYEIEAGFTFRNEINKEYPTFHRIVKIIEK